MTTYAKDRLEEAAQLTVQKEVGVLRTAWKWGRRKGLCEGDLSLPAISSTRTRERYTPSVEEAHQVLGVLKGWQRTIYMLLLATGFRVGEAASLTWADVDLESGWMTLVGKTGPRDVPIPPYLVDELASIRPEAPEGDLRVLSSVKLRTARSSSRKPLKKACERAGVKRFTAHGLRRLAVNRLVLSGVDVGTAAAFLGHSVEVMLAEYRSVTRADKRRALARAGLADLGVGQVMKFPATKKING